MTDQGVYSEASALAACFRSERVTGIEPALSAWESVWLQRSTWPDLRVRVSQVTVRDRLLPGLIAR
jgi:hypothetical protein